MGEPRSRARRALGLAAAGLVVAAVAFVLGVAWPNYRDMALQAKAAEVPANVEAIRAAEQAHIAAHGRPLAAGPAPVAVDALRPNPQPWPPGTAFDTLGWAPEGPVRGTYAVRLTEDGSGFVVHGWIDGDGDGVPAHFTATGDRPVERQTGRRVY